MSKRKHQDNEGRPTSDRGIPPHLGGYHGAKKGVSGKTWFEILAESGKRLVVQSKWKP